MSFSDSDRNLLQRLISEFNQSCSGDVPKPRTVVAQLFRDNNFVNVAQKHGKLYCNHKKCNP